MTYKDEASYGSSPPCIAMPTFDFKELFGDLVVLFLPANQVF